MDVDAERSRGILWDSKKSLARITIERAMVRPTRFELVLFAFEGQVSL
jgi:hypothetical protein